MSESHFKAQILNCEVKDSTGLSDFQKLPEDSGIGINKVGISRFRIPLSYYHSDGSIVNHDTIASMYVTLESGKTGINMSRLPAFMQEEAQEHPVGMDFLRSILQRYHIGMRDSEKEPPLSNAWLKLRFSYPIKQKSLKSNNEGWQYYDCELEGKSKMGADGTHTIRVFLTVSYEYSSTCPCSASMALQYQEDYRKGLTTEGNGIATAHAQRSICKCTIEFSPNEIFMIEDLVKLLKKALPTETQTLVKRVDEQFFAILNGENLMFVEHATRRLAQVLNSEKRILDWVCSVEHQESLHSHNAVGVIYKGIDQGLR